MSVKKMNNKLIITTGREREQMKLIKGLFTSGQRSKKWFCKELILPPSLPLISGRRFLSW
jgi:hypothetical protein